MTLSRQQFWLFLQACVIILFLMYEGMWLTGKPVAGVVTDIERGSGRYKSIKFAVVQWEINGELYEDYYLMDDDFSRYSIGTRLSMKYLPFAKFTARVNGITAGKAEWGIVYLFFLIITAAIFVLPNFVIERKSSFIVSLRRPFIKYVVNKPVQKKEVISLIERSNLVAGYIEKFMFPFMISMVIALILYLCIWQSWIVWVCMVAGIIFGVRRARKWAHQLKPHAPELYDLDNQPTWSDEYNRRR